MCSVLNECPSDSECLIFKTRTHKRGCSQSKVKGEFVHMQNEIPCHESILGVGCSFRLSYDQGEMEVSGQRHAAATLLLIFKCAVRVDRLLFCCFYLRM